MSWKTGLALLGIVLVILLFLFGRPSDIKGADAKRLVSDGAKLVDVRTPEEFASGHIAGAVNVPVGQLESRLDELGPKTGTIVVYCRSGNRSAQAQKLLRASGWTTVHNLGPMAAWPD